MIFFYDFFIDFGSDFVSRSGFVIFGRFVIDFDFVNLIESDFGFGIGLRHDHHLP